MPFVPDKQQATPSFKPDGDNNAEQALKPDFRDTFRPRAGDAIDPNAQAGPPDEIPSGEAAVRTGESLVNGYTAGITKPIFALSGAAGMSARNAISGDPDKSVVDPNSGSSFADNVQTQTNRQKQYESENPVKSTVANVAGALAPNSVVSRVFGGIGKLIGAGAKAVAPVASGATDAVVGEGTAGALAKSRLAQWLGGTAKDAAVGAGTGAASEGIGGAANALTDGNASLDKTGEDMKRGALFGAAIPTAINVAKPVGQLGGRLLAKMNPKAADTLVNDPDRVYDYYNKMKGPDSNPQALHTEMQGMATDASSALNSKQDALMGQYKAQLPGKNVRVNSSRLSDTGIPAVDQELQRIKGLQPSSSKVQVPVSEVAGPPDITQRVGGFDPKAEVPPEPVVDYHARSQNAPVSDLQGQAKVPDPYFWQRALKQAAQSDRRLLPQLRNPLPGPVQTVETPTSPDAYTLSGEQAHNLARTAQDNTTFANQGIYGSTATGAAKGLGMALKEGLHSVGGDGAGSLSDLDGQMSQNAKLGRVFRKMTANDPTAGIGSPGVAKQAALQRMDAATGSDLYGANKALTSAKSFKPGVIPAAGRSVLWSIGKGSQKELGDTSLKAILGLMNQNSGEEK